MTQQVIISRSEKPTKRLKATFPNKTVHFGSRGGSTFVDHKNETAKRAWEARHKVNENWRDYDTAGALAKHVLWSKKSMKSSVAALNTMQKEYKFALKT